MSAACDFATLRHPEDPLAHLVCSDILNFRKGSEIYGPDNPSARLHLIIDGRVKICRVAEGGQQVIMDIYQADELFGECAVLPEPKPVEIAIALENSKIMVWPIKAIFERSMSRPKLAMAILQVVTQRSMDFSRRIEGFSVDSVPRRLARALIRFSERLPKQAQGDSVRIASFTHVLLSQYVGSCPHVVSHYMNQFQRQGYLRYAHKGIELSVVALREWLKTDSAPA